MARAAHSYCDQICTNIDQQVLEKLWEFWFERKPDFEPKSYLLCTKEMRFCGTF
jgi:hypothetical protein